MNDNKLEKKMLFLYESDNDGILEINSQEILQIYCKLVDRKSREIFQNRVLLSVINSHEYVKNLALITEEGNDFYKTLASLKSIYIYGAGMRGKRLITLFPELNWAALIDKKESGLYKGYNIIKLDDFEYDNNSVILISNLYHVPEIKGDLIKLGIPEEHMIVMNDYEMPLVQKQYFDDSFWGDKNIKKGVFIDGGSYDGKDAISFLTLANKKDMKVIAFEPDKKNYKICLQNVKSDKRIDLRCIGLSDDCSIEHINSDGEESRISACGDEIKTDTIDTLLAEEKCAYIKLDIEGYELKAIIGAQKVIRRDHPTLMVSVYHKREDILEIPKELLKIDNSYRFMLRHYRIGGSSDTVLYAF